MADCVAFVDDLINYMLNHVPAPTNFNVVRATLSIHQSNHTVSYSYPGLTFLQFVNQPDLVFTQRLFQYFGDRIGNPGNPATEQPFDQTQKDGVTLNIYKSPIRVELVLESWGSVRMTFQPVQCIGNLMYYLAYDQVLVLSLEKAEATIIL